VVAWYFPLSTLSLVLLFLASTALADPRPYLVRHAPVMVKRSATSVGDGYYPAVDSQCFSQPSLWNLIPLLDHSSPPSDVLVDPVVVGVFWPGAVAVDASSRALFPDFVKDLFDGPLWAAEMPQYVGSSHGSYLSSHDITLLTLAPSTTVLTTQIGPELAAQVAAGGLPAASFNTVYVVHFPPGITITDPGGIGTSCVDFCAYHDFSYVVPGDMNTLFTFTVQPDFTQNAGCQAGCGLGTPFDKYTEVLTHELFETTTNPYSLGWSNDCSAILGGEEMADLCESYLFDTPRLTASSGAPQCPNRWAMQAMYSNAASGVYGPSNGCAVAGSTVDSACVEPVAVCGNGVVEPGEQCDDGDATGQPGDCCTASCQFQPAGVACADEGDLCTLDLCNATGTCTHSIAPSPVCATPTVAQGASLLLQIKSPGKNQAQFKWGKGPVVPLSDFGNPSGSELTRICVYTQTAPNTWGLALRGSPSVSGGGLWKSSDTGWKFTSKTGSPDSITGVVLKSASAPLKAKVQVKAKGNPALSALPLQTSPGVVAQFKTSLGTCWGATFSTPTVNTATKFKAKSD
jgi:cysteine-rich repeat protein